MPFMKSQPKYQSFFFPKFRSPQNDPSLYFPSAYFLLLLSKSTVFLLDSLLTIISASASLFSSFSFSIPPQLTLSFCFHWTASRWDNILMALLTGKTPTADFHQGKLETKTIPYCQVEFHTEPGQSPLSQSALQLKLAETPKTGTIRKILRRASVLSRLLHSLQLMY